MKRTHRHIAELAMMMAIPMSVTGGPPKGRIGGLMARLDKIVGRELERLPRVGKAENLRISKKIAEWGELTGWGKGSRHIITMVSFALEMMERSEFTYPQRAYDTLSEIVDYFDRQGKASAMCYWGGARAADKWHMIFYNA